MRLALDPRRGTLYIADTGHHRILEVDVGVDTAGSSGGGVVGMVRRVIGSPTGLAGAASDGTTVAKALFNRPMGLSLGYDGVLTVADAGNDAVRRVQLYADGPSASGGVSSALPPQVR